MRRTDRELTGISELRAILDQCDAMRIAGQDAEGFFIFPVNFGYTVEGGSIEVGKASTDSVVCSSVLILFADIILTKLLMG